MDIIDEQRERETDFYHGYRKYSHTQKHEKGPTPFFHVCLFPNASYLLMED